jgi:cytosine/adenosine deaminase-related metal-dependent hydrolase
MALAPSRGTRRIWLVVALEAVIFAATAADVRNVVIGGRDIVADGRHLLVDDVPAALRSAIRDVLS